MTLDETDVVNKAMESLSGAVTVADLCACSIQDATASEVLSTISNLMSGVVETLDPLVTGRPAIATAAPAAGDVEMRALRHEDIEGLELCLSDLTGARAVIELSGKFLAPLQKQALMGAAGLLIRAHLYVEGVLNPTKGR